MKKRFLEVCHDIRVGKLSQLTGLWLTVGNELLVQDWFVDAVRPMFHANHQAVKRLELTSPKHWQTVLDELSSLSLFAEGVALIVSGTQKCDDKTLAKLANFANENGGHCLIYQLPKQDKKAQEGKLFQTFKNNGVVVDCEIYSEQDRQQLLVFKADEFGLRLDSAAWQMLLSHTESHLLAAHQALWRASDLYAERDDAFVLGVEQLLPVLVSDYQYSVFKLCDELLLGNAQKALHILNHLKHTYTEPSVILWAIGKEIRLILQLQTGKTYAQLRIWQSKIPLYQAAQARALPSNILNSIYQTDQCIKGLDEGDVWMALRQLCLAVCGSSFLIAYDGYHRLTSETKDGLMENI